MLHGIDVSAVVFYVKSLDRSLKFYGEVLGLPTRIAAGHDGDFGIAEAGRTLLVLLERDEKPGRTPIIVFGLESGIEDVVEELARKGVEILVPVSEAPDGGLSSDFGDPDGHVLSVYQPAGAARRRSR